MSQVAPSSPGAKGAKAAPPSPVFSPEHGAAQGTKFDELVLGEVAKNITKVMSPEMHAAVNGGESVLEFLTDEGALSSRTKFGETAMHRAVRGGALVTVNELIEAGAEIDSRDGLGKTPLMTCCSTRAKKYTQGHFDVAMRLIEAGADPLAIDSKNSTALARAAENGHMNLVLALLKKGADPDSVDKDGKTPLMLAAHAHTKVAELLLRADHNAQFRQHKAAAVNTKDKAGKTPLMMAAAGRNAETVGLLLAKGADPFAEDNNGKTALKYCKKAPDAEAKLDAAVRKGNGGGKKK